MKFVLATQNPKKLKEMSAILGELGVEVVSEADLGVKIEVEETGETFAENSLLKAKAVMEATKLPAIADDSGLCVDALNGGPGVYSARYAGHHGDDDANNEKLLREMADVPEGQRGARFVSAVCFMLPDGRALEVEGECPGRIAFSLQNGDYGFGYDPLFVPDGYDKSFAQLSSEEKNRISHRAAALCELERLLKERAEAND